MRNEFIGYYELKQSEYNKLWENAIIVFDTNVLLDLYRYHKTTRDDLLKVMEKLKSRLFIPHHVMLEFHQNRNSVIIDQFNKFDEVKSIVETKIEDLVSELQSKQLDEKYSDIELKSFTKDLEKNVAKFFKGLEKSKIKSSNPNKEDKILSKIERLFSSKIGKPFNEKEIKTIYEDGERRYKSEIPPGYKDDKKTDEYIHNNVLIKKKFGDLLIWKQIIEYSQKHENTDLIFVTRDVKEDWFWQVRGQTIKCRPELTEEICNLTKVERFKIYNPARFLEFASNFLESNLAEGVLNDVKSVSSRSNLIKQRRRLNYKIIEMAVISWLENQGKTPLVNNEPYPNLEVRHNEFHIGYEIKVVYTSNYSLKMVMHELERARSLLRSASSYLNQISIIYVFEEVNVANLEFMIKAKNLATSDGASLVFGILTEGHEFRPLDSS